MIHWLYFLGFAFLAWLLLVRVVQYLLDLNRIRKSLINGRCQCISLRWSPLGKGWLNSNGDRIYKVRYLDELDQEHTAICKTSLGSGVFWTENQKLKPLSLADRILALENENAELRQQIQDLLVKNQSSQS